MHNDVTPASGPAERDRQQHQPPQTKTVADQHIINRFKTPEQVAAADDLAAPAAQPMVHPPAESPDLPPPKKPWYTRLFGHLRRPHTKKGYALVAVVLLVVVGVGAVGVFALTRPTKPVVAVVSKPKVVPPKPAPKPTTVASTLSGLQVDPSLNARPITAAMIENSLAARPQAGLGEASVVFEAVAEGGVTRFMALFQDTAPDNIGPIRSARPYYVGWALGFDAGYAHVGGSQDGLADIKAWGVRDLDQFFNGGSYHRISSRAAPHNVYTGVPTLIQLEQAKGYTSSNFTGFARKVAAPTATPTAKTIDMKLSGYYYDAHFDYNAATNTYNRSEAGVAHIDSNTNKQISPNVVVAMVTPLGQGELDSSGAYYSNYNILGDGTAIVFQDGVATTGQWHKATNSTALSFTDSTGAPLALNPGQTWITAISSAAKVSYTP